MMLCGENRESANFIQILIIGITFSLCQASEGKDFVVPCSSLKSENKTSDECKQANEGNFRSNEFDTCKLYMAESSIPNAGLGIYTAKDLSVGESVGDGDIALPYIDVPDVSKMMVKSYAWSGQVYGMHTEADNVDVFCPGILALINGHQGLNNVAGKAIFSSDGAGLHRSKDPGAGAFTSYYNTGATAEVPISAGSELLVSYGDHWYVFETRAKKFTSVPLSFHFEEADEMLDKFGPFLKEQENNINHDDLETFWKFVRENFVASPNACQLLPESVRNVENAWEQKSAMFNAPSNFIRTPEWLTEHGLCMDNLRTGISKIPQAGRGSFATRFMPKGSFVAPAPLMHECKRNNYLIHEGTAYNGMEDHNFDYSPYPVTGKQLMLNYCFGHRRSTLLLCPYGAQVGFINHSSDNPNVQIRWSTHSYHHQDWLDLTVDELCHKEHTGLMFDFVALRDILPGEEVLLDYGKEWEDAWNKHVKEWVPPESSEDYVPASYFNENEMVVRTLEEQETNPYPENVHTECYFQYSDDNSDKFVDEVPHRPYQGYDSAHDLLNCNIYERKTFDGADLYLAGMKLWWGQTEDSHETMVYNIPREAIIFKDAAYTTDMHLNGAFRHEIMVPQEMFPSAWKNLLFTDDSGKV